MKPDRHIDKADSNTSAPEWSSRLALLRTFTGVRDYRSCRTALFFVIFSWYIFCRHFFGDRYSPGSYSLLISGYFFMRISFRFSACGQRYRSMVLLFLKSLSLY